MAFLKNLASSVLNSLLSNYFESFENKVVSFSLGGELELTELVIKRNILDNLRLPLKIKFGSVGRLKLVVPWTDLSKKPTTVMLDDVYLIAESNTNTKYDPAEEENRLQQLKISKLKMFEMLQESKKQEGAENKKEDNSFGKRLATTIVDNLQLYINRVHVRFEETQNRIPFSMGLTIESLYGQSTDQNYKPAILPGATTTFKLVTLQNLAIYFNMGDAPLQFKSVKEAYQVMESLIYKSDNLPKHNFILKPMSIGVKLVINKQANSQNKLPKATANLLTESIFLRVNKDQFGAALATANRFTSLTLGAKYLKYRPQVTVKEKPAVWWGFALNSVMDDLNQKRNQYRWSTIKQRRDDRLLYVDLFQQIRLGKKLTPENDVKLKALEKRLTYEDIIYFRSLAEIKSRQYKKVEEQQQGKQSKIGGFFSGLFEKKEEKEQKQKKIMEEVLKVQFTEQDAQEVYRALELSETVDTGPSNPEWIQYQVGVTLQLASVVLGDETGPVANMVLEKFVLGFDLRDKWQTFRTELDSMMVMDNTSQTSLFPNIVRPVMTDTKLWTMRVDLSPHNVPNVDIGIEMIAKPLNIVMNGGFISRIIKIFSAPVGEQIKSRFTSNINANQLQYLLENKKNIAMRIDLQAPNILVPQSFDKPNAPMLVVDLGKLNIGTVLAMKNPQGKDDDLTASAYDSLEIALSKLQICLTTADKQADVHLLKAEMIKLIDPFTVDLTLQLSKLPDVETLSKVKLQGKMPSLKVNVSPNSLRNFIQILQSLLAQINAMTASDGPQFPNAKDKQIMGGDAFAREVMMQAMEQKKSNVKVFEGDFTISEAIISLMKSDTEPLLRVNFKGFEGTVNVQSLEVSVKAKLHGLIIEDLLQKYGPRGANLASSLSDADPGNDLVNFSFVTTNREAPQYNNIDSLMLLEFNTLKFVFNPVTMITTINLILQQLQPMNQQPQQQAVVEEIKSDGSHAVLKPVTQEELNFKRRGAHRTTFKMNIKMNSLQLMLNEEQPLAEASLGNSSAEIIVNEAGEVKIHGRLGALALSDSRAKERFRHVLKVDGEHLVDFKFQIDRSDRFANTDELSLNIDMNTLRVLYSHKFIMDIANYFVDFADLMNKFNQKDQPEVKPAPANAKNSIFTFQVAAQNIYVVGSSLDPSATQALIIELGQINVGNSFSALPEPDTGFRDKLEVSIRGMNARSGDMTSEDWRSQDLSPRNAHSEDKLLQDLTLALFIERPLFVNPLTYQGPTLTLTANIPEISLNLSTNLAYLLLGLLKGNIFYEPSAKEIAKWRAEQQKKLALEQANPSPVVSPAASPNVPAKKDKRPTTKIAFIIPKLSIKLAHSNPAAEHGVEPLLMMDAIKFNFSLDQFDDDSNEISLDLFALMLRDLKSKDKELHSDFKTFVRPKNQNEGQFGMKFFTKDSGHQDLAIKVDSFNIILIPKLIKSLIQSIMPVIKELTGTLAKKDESRKLFLMEDVREQRLNELRKSRKIGFDMSFVVTRPQVFLIEDLTLGTSRAAIFTADFDVRFFIYGAQQKLNAYAKNLQMFKTNALSNSIELSADKQFNILKPADVMLLMEISPEVFDLHVELSPLDITLSYRDFKLGYKLAEPFLQTEEQPVRPQLEPLNNNNEAFVKSRSSPRMSPKFNAGSHRAEAEKPQVPAGPVRDEKVDLSQTSIQLHIVDDVAEAEPISLFQLSLTKIDAFVAAWSSKLKVRSAASLQANYYNSSLRVWEPFIEPMVFEVGVTGAHVSVVSEYSLNVNVTKALTRQAQQTYKKWKADFTNTPLKPRRKDMQDALMGRAAEIQALETSQYAVLNRTSVDLEMRFDVNNVNVGKQAEPQTYQLKAKSEPVSIPSDVMQMAVVSIKPAGMNLKWSKRINLRDYRANSNIVALDFEGEPGQSATRFYFAIAVIEEVVMNTKAAIITISPALVIDNQLLADMDYFIFPAGANTEISRAKVPKQETVAVLDLPVDKNLQMAIRIPGFNKCIKLPLSPFKANNTAFSLMDDQGKTFKPNYELSIDAYGTAIATIYSPYWIINKSGLPLVFCTGKESKSVAPLQNQLKLDKDYQNLLLGEIEPRELYFKEFLNEAPLMLAFPNDPDLVMRMSGGYVSKPLSLKAQNSKGYVTVTNEKKDSKSQKLFELAVSVEPAKNRFWRTKVVIVYPRFFFVNKTSKTIFIMQEGVTKSFSLLPQETYPFHWPFRKPANKERERAIAVKTDNPNCDWSGAFPIDEQANYSITMRTLASQALGQLRVQSRLRDDGITIVDFYETNDNPLYCIQNNFSEPIIVFQKGGRVRLNINPKSISNWGFDEPRLDPIVVVEVPRLKQLFQVNMDVITGTENEEEEDKKKKQNVPVQLQVNVEGGARVLSVTPQTGKPAVPKLAVESKETFRFTVKLRQIGISIINQKPEELLFFCVDNFMFTYVNYPEKRTLELFIKDFQIDNQVSYTLPTAMYSVAEAPPQFLRMSAVFSNLNKSVNHIQYFSVLLRETFLALDERTLLKLLYFVDITLETLQNDEDHEFGMPELPENIIENVANDPMQLNWVFASLIHINPMKFHITFIGNRDKTTEKSNMTSILLGIPKDLIVNIDRAPLQLRGVIIENQLSTQQVLASTLLQNFKQQLIREVYKLVGSAEFLGNPIGFVQSLGTGVSDFFYEPAKGVTVSPEEFVHGVAKGTWSLVKNSIFGLFNSASKFTGSLGSGVAVLSWDEDYQRQRQEDRQQNKPKHALEGFGQGLLGLGKGIFHGVTGIIAEPIKGAQSEGGEGFFKGLGRGLAGVVVKPVVGALDLASKTTEGISNTTELFDKKVKRKRPPRHFATNKLEVYNQDQAHAEDILHTIGQGRHREEKFMFRVSLPEGVYMIVSDQTIVVRNGKENKTISRMPFSDVKSIGNENSIVIIGLLSQTERQKGIKCNSPEDAAATAEKLKVVFNLWQQSQKQLF